MKLAQNNNFNIFIIILWLLIVVFTMFHHELWRDEAQVWCIVRDCSLIETFKTASVEGHPMLWYLILMPFAKMGLPVVSMQIISVLFVFAAVVYFVYKSPFNIAIKLAVIFSSGMLYYLPVIARNYALIPLFLFILADLYKKRKENPYKYAVVLILLSNTHVLILALCVILFLFFLYEKFIEAKETNNGKVLFPALLIGANLIFLAVSLSGVIMHNHAVTYYMHEAKPFLDAVKFFPFYFFEIFFFAPEFICISVFYILIAAILAVLFKYSTKLFCILSVCYLYIFVIYQKIWFNGVATQKAYILILCILFTVWVFNEKHKNKILSTAIFIIFFLSCIGSLYVILLETKYNFSDAKQTSDYIKNNLNKENTFCTIGSNYFFTAISAYLPDKNFYSLMNRNFYSYHNFNSLNKKTEINEPVCKYYIVHQNYDMIDGYKIIFSSDDIILIDKEYPEVFKIYEITKE